MMRALRRLGTRQATTEEVDVSLCSRGPEVTQEPFTLIQAGWESLILDFLDWFG